MQAYNTPFPKPKLRSKLRTRNEPQLSLSIIEYPGKLWTHICFTNFFAKIKMIQVLVNFVIVIFTRVQDVKRETGGVIILIIRVFVSCNFGCPKKRKNDLFWCNLQLWMLMFAKFDRLWSILISIPFWTNVGRSKFDFTAILVQFARQ